MYIRKFMFLRVRILKTGVRKGNRRDAWLNYPDQKNPENNVVWKGRAETFPKC